MKANINKILFTFIRIASSILIILFLIYAGMELSKMGYDFGYRVFTEPAMEEAPGKDVLVQVHEDTSIRELGQLLEEKGLVRDSKLFFIQTELSVYKKKIVPGVYTLNTSMTAKEMLAIMATPLEDTESTETETPVETQPAAQPENKPESTQSTGEPEAGPAGESDEGTGEDVDQDMLEGAQN